MSIRKLTTLPGICGKRKIRQGKVTLGYDCEGAIQAVQGGWIITSRWNSYDLLYHINKELRERPIEWEFRWVRGHQDRKKLKKNQVYGLLPTSMWTKMLNGIGDTSVGMVLLQLNILRRIVCYGEYVQTVKLSPKRSRPVYTTTTTGFEKPRNFGSDDLTSQALKSMIQIGVLSSGHKWHLPKRNVYGVANTCKILV